MCDYKMCSNNVILVLVSFQTNRPTTSFYYEIYAGEVNKFYSAATWTWLKIGVIKRVFFSISFMSIVVVVVDGCNHLSKPTGHFSSWPSVVRTHTFSRCERCGASKCLLITERRNAKSLYGHEVVQAACHHLCHHRCHHHIIAFAMVRWPYFYARSYL